MYKSGKQKNEVSLYMYMTFFFCTAVLFIFNYLLFFLKNSKFREVDYFYYRYIYVYHHGTNIHLHTCIIQSCEMMRIM